MFAYVVINGRKHNFIYKYGSYTVSLHSCKYFIDTKTIMCD